MKKSIKIIIFIIASVILAWYVFGFVMTFGHQREPQINMPPELGELEAQLHKETRSGISTFFKPSCAKSPDFEHNMIEDLLNNGFCNRRAKFL